MKITTRVTLLVAVFFFSVAVGGAQRNVLFTRTFVPVTLVKV